jgi:hypothetical protein
VFGRRAGWALGVRAPGLELEAATRAIDLGWERGRERLRLGERRAGGGVRRRGAERAHDLGARGGRRGLAARGTPAHSRAMRGD